MPLRSAPSNQGCALTVSEAVACRAHEDLIDEDDRHAGAHVAAPCYDVHEAVAVGACHAEGAEARGAGVAPDGPALRTPTQLGDCFVCQFDLLIAVDQPRRDRTGPSPRLKVVTVLVLRLSVESTT
jgi:hypothetical protein